MFEDLRILKLLMNKNWIVRKRRWFGSIVELTLPALIIAAILIVRSYHDITPVHVNENTYFPIETKQELIDDHVSKTLLNIYYIPKNGFTDELMKNVTQCMELSHQHLFGFDSEDEMLQTYEIQQGEDEMISMLAVNFLDSEIVYDGESITPNKLIYTIRSSQKIPENLFNFEDLNVASDRLISDIPIVPLQMCLDDSFINRAAPINVTKPKVVIQKIPYPPYDNINDSELLIQYAICFFGGIIFSATIYLIPPYVSAEKTSGVITLLKFNGVKSYQNFLSWLLSGMVFSILPVIFITILFNSSFQGEKPMYFYSDCLIVLLALYLNLCHIYAFCLHAASYFTKAWLAQIVTITIAILMHIIIAQLADTQYFVGVPYMGILIPTVAGTRIFDELNKRENELTGAQWHNVFETIHPALDVTGSLGFLMLSSILGIILHFILAIYLDAVLPDKYGSQKSPFYFLKYFFNKSNKPNQVTNGVIAVEQPMIVEPTDGVFTPCIVLKDLVKSFNCGCFKSSMVKAVKGINLTFYKGQITALLGKNGAGKTTTFSILNGSTPPTAGTVFINGKDMSKNLDTIRNDLGVCLQENTVFPDLTVEEQFKLVGFLKRKNQTEDQVLHEVDEMLNKLKMEEKRDVLPDKLSGGQKRRLCLGMALIGDASTIFLDEPTSGMDPETRRRTWDVLLQHRNKKTIIITTHSMEEADVLGDRIAIMQSGKMTCYGTPMYLKKYFGHNYHKVTLSTTTWCDEQKIQEMVGSEAKIKVTHHGRMVISLPFTNSLPEILDNMEKQKIELGITGVSVSTITLEQVFLKAADQENPKLDPDSIDGPKESVANEYKHLKGPELMRQQIKALLKKKLTYFKSDKYLFLTMICAALLSVVLPVLSYSNKATKPTTLSLDLSLYQSPEVLIYSKTQMFEDIYKKIIESQGAIGSLTDTSDSLSNDLLCIASTDLTYSKTHMIIAAEFNSTSLANGLYSGGATLSAPITLNAMSNLVLKTLAGDQYSIVSSIGELPQTLKRDANEKSLISIGIITRTILFVTIFFHVVGLFVKHPLLEDITKVKQLQRMAGVSAFMYWGTTFIIDYAVYIFLTLLTILGMVQLKFLDIPSPLCQTELGILLLLFLLFGINVLLFAYIHSFMKKPFHMVYGSLSAIPLLLTIIMVSSHLVLPKVDIAKSLITTQRRIFSLEPHVSFIFGYIKLAEITSENARCRGLSNRLNKAACVVDDICCDMKCADGHCENPLPYFGGFKEDGGLEEFLMYSLLTPILLVGILYLLERQQIFARSQSEPKSDDHDKPMDTEVEMEKNIVCQGINQYASEPNSNNNNNNVFMAYKLSKSYKKVKAVKEVNFRVKKNECFGLLGVNGAGKSTTFRMLAGEEVPSSGILHRGPYSIKNNRTEYLSKIGYCPQSDALIPYFNAVEHLSLFASLRGIPDSQVQSEVESWINKLQLKGHAESPSGFYSGGYKRRLNIAMALIGDPELILLDEPTTGVDPGVRRLVWSIVQRCQAAGQAIILTSHSMDECEALCDRIVIMAKGKLMCIGASQELKKNFGAGYNITIKLDPRRSEHDFIEIKKKMKNSLVCELKNEHSGNLLYHITDSETSWVKMFGIMNELQSEHNCIEDFTVSTSTLEQLFMQIAMSSADTPVESDDPNNELICV